MSAPTRLGRYAVRRLLGTGGFATVWLGYDEQLDSPVAIKVLADNWAADHHVRDRFVEEGRYLRRVESRHVVPVYDAGELADGRPYLVMAFADQGTLAERIAEDPPGLRESVEIVRQAGTGLQALHRRDLLHRDIKPANVLFRTSSEGEVRAMVGDLGLGKAIDTSSRLTMIGGTPSYAAPEQARGERLDRRADQYSLGVLAHVLLTGAPPHRHATLTDAAAPGPVAPLTGSDGPLPEQVDEVVRRALASDREDRFPEVEDFTAALQAAIGSEEVTRISSRRRRDQQSELTVAAAPPGSTTSSQLSDRSSDRQDRDRSRLRWWVLAGVLALMVGIGGGYLIGQRLDSTETVTDDEGRIALEVPASWLRYRALQGWTPPGEEEKQPGLAVGSDADWQTETDQPASGVFAGIMPADAMPEELPEHPDCAEAERSTGRVEGDRTLTVVWSECPDGGLIIERARRITGSHVLWVQVRSDDRAEAYRVLDSIRVNGY